MNIIEAAKKLADGKYIRRRSWRYTSLVAEDQKEPISFWQLGVRRDTAGISVEDLLADDWEYFDE
jgi:hypothetical protein